MRFAAVPLVAVAFLGALASEPGQQSLTFEDRARTQDHIDAVNSDVSAKVTLCHIPPGNSAKAHTIVVRQTAVEAHLAHGDYLGECHPVCAGVPSPLPKTGQTQCRSDSPPYDPIDCTGTGQDGEYQNGVSLSPRFTDNLNGTATDNLTGLIWLQDSECLGETYLSAARQAALALSDGTCGLTDASVAGDWRLPNIRELLSLVDYGNSNPALPEGHPFPQTPSIYYWSSTLAASFPPNAAWSLNLISGSTIPASAYIEMRVWPVRGGP